MLAGPSIEYQRPQERASGGFLVESFVSHPFRKERGKDGAPSLSFDDQKECGRSRLGQRFSSGSQCWG